MIFGYDYEGLTILRNLNFLDFLFLVFAMKESLEVIELIRVFNSYTGVYFISLTFRLL